jgi:hypothetical protein
MPVERTLQQAWGIYEVNVKGWSAGKMVAHCDVGVAFGYAGILDVSTAVEVSRQLMSFFDHSVHRRYCLIGRNPFPVSEPWSSDQGTASEYKYHMLILT